MVAFGLGRGYLATLVSAAALQKQRLGLLRRAARRFLRTGEGRRAYDSSRTAGVGADRGGWGRRVARTQFFASPVEPVSITKAKKHKYGCGHRTAGRCAGGNMLLTMVFCLGKRGSRFLIVALIMLIVTLGYSFYNKDSLWSDIYS